MPVPELTVVVPVHNEEDNLELCCRKLLDCFGPETEILFVNDGSTDRSLEILKSLVRLHPSVRALTLSRHCGQNCALIAGFQKARAQVIVSFDADLQYDCEDHVPLVNLLSEGHPVVIGHRQDNGHGLAHKLGRFLASRIISSPVPDPFCPVKGMRSEVLVSVGSISYHLSFPGLALLSLGLPVLSVPLQTRSRQRGRSSYGPLRLATRFLSLLLLNCTGWAPRPTFQSSELPK